MLAQVLLEGLILGILLMGGMRIRDSKGCCRDGARDFWSGFWQLFV